MRTRSRVILRAALAASLTLATAAALSQTGPANYPVKPIRIVVPFSAGGPADVHEKLVATGADPYTMTVEDFSRFLRADIERWDKVVKAAGVKLEP